LGASRRTRPKTIHVNGVSSMKTIRLLYAVFLLATAGVGLAFSQAVNGTLLGTVLDSTGAVVPNAQVTATETNTGLSRTTNTGDAGNYVFANVPPGTYTVSVELTGFKKAVRAGIDVIVNTTVRTDLTLEPGSITETINITAEAAIL